MCCNAVRAICSTLSRYSLFAASAKKITSMISSKSSALFVDPGLNLGGASYSNPQSTPKLLSASLSPLEQLFSSLKMLNLGLHFFIPNKPRRNKEASCNRIVGQALHPENLFEQNQYQTVPHSINNRNNTHRDLKF